MADKKKLINGSSADSNLRPDGTDRRYEYPEIDLEKAQKGLEELEKGDPEFREFMEKGRKLAREARKGVKRNSEERGERLLGLAAKEGRLARRDCAQGKLGKMLA